MSNTITALYIVKNESGNIKRSIESVRDFVDDIIVVDTGSTDNTIELCESLDCKVFTCQWKNDFSKARNYAKSLTNSDYILFLDADEYFSNPLTSKDRENILNIISEHDVDGVSFKTSNYDDITSKLQYTSYHCKFFKNKGDIKYERAIHEVLRINGKPISYAIYLDVELIHVGYSSNISGVKALRNIDILKTLKNPETIDYFYLAREHLAIVDYERFNYYCNKFFEQEDYREVVENSSVAYLIYFYRYDYLRGIGVDYKDWIDKMQAELPDVAEVDYTLGEIYEDINYTDAYNYYLSAIKKNDSRGFDRVNFFGLCEDDLYYRLSKIDMIFGDKSKAINRAVVACMLDKYNVNYLVHLLNLVKNRKPDKIIDMIYRIYRPKITSDFEVIITALSNTKLNVVFLYFLNEYNTKYNGGSPLVYIGMMLSNQIDLALEVAVKNYKKNKAFVLEEVILIGLILKNDTEYYEKYRCYLTTDCKNILDYNYGYTDDLYIDNPYIYGDVYVTLYFMGKESLLRFSIEHFGLEGMRTAIISLERAGYYSDAIKLCELTRENDCFVELNVFSAVVELKSLLLTNNKKKAIELYNKIKKTYSIPESLVRRLNDA